MDDEPQDADGDGRPRLSRRAFLLSATAAAGGAAAIAVAVDHHGGAKAGGPSSGPGASDAPGDTTATTGPPASTAPTPASVTFIPPADAGHLDVVALGADPTGAKDCTALLQKLIGENIGGAGGRPCVLYFPAGTYLISSSLCARNGSGTWFPNLTLRGESAATTTIKMTDGVWPGTTDYHGVYPTNPGFANADHVENAMLVTGTYGATSGNNGFNNYVFDLTFDLGDNPGGGCIGFLVNNVGAIRRCNFTCTAGFIGVDLGRGITGPGIITDCRFRGPFAAPWLSFGLDYSFIMERCVVETNSPGGHSGYQGFVMGIKDCQFVQPVRTIAAGADTTFWDSPGIRSVNDRGGRVQYLAPGTGGFKIPSVDTPLVAYDPPSEWVNAATFPGGVQAAFDSGKSTVYFPTKASPGISPTITVPASVNRVICFGFGPVPATWDQTKPFFETIGSSDTPLTFEWGNQQPQTGSDTATTRNDQNTYTYLRHSSTRDLVMADWSGFGIIQGTDGGGRIFFDDVFLRCHLGPGNELYARQLNWEDPFVTCVSNAGGRAWIFGLKTEWPCSVPQNWPSYPCGNFQPTVLGTAGGRTDMCVGFSLPNTGVPSTLTQYDFIDASYALSWIDFQTVPINWKVDVSSSPGGTVTSVANPGTQGTRGTAFLSHRGG